MKVASERGTGIVVTSIGRIRVSLMAFGRAEVSTPKYIKISGMRIDFNFVLTWTAHGWEVDPEFCQFHDYWGERVPAPVRARLLRQVQPAALEWIHRQPRSAWAAADRASFKINKRGFVSYNLPVLLETLQESAQVFGWVIRTREFGACDGLYESLRDIGGRCRDLIDEVNAVKRKTVKVGYARAKAGERGRSIALAQAV